MLPPFLSFGSVFPALCWTSLSTCPRLKASSKYPQINSSHLITSLLARCSEWKLYELALTSGWQNWPGMSCISQAPFPVP